LNETLTEIFLQKTCSPVLPMEDITLNNYRIFLRVCLDIEFTNDVCFTLELLPTRSLNRKCTFKMIFFAVHSIFDAHVYTIITQYWVMVYIIFGYMIHDAYIFKFIWVNPCFRELCFSLKRVL